ncbi:MAG: hypothetical protein AAGA08_16075 [Pseudomonadota bacterium]
MRVFDRYPTIFLIIAAAILAAVYLEFSEISLTGLGAQDLATKFLSLAFMALVIERAVEIYIKNRFSDEEATLKRDLRLAATSVRVYKDALAATAATVVPSVSSEAETTAAVAAKYDHVDDLRQKLETSRDTLLDAKRKAEPHLQALQASKKRAATIAALLLSLAVAIVGLRILAQFIPPETLATGTTAAVARSVTDTVTSQFQVQAFHAIDIILTALLLSGGADGIHQLVKDFLSDRDELLSTS